MLLGVSYGKGCHMIGCVISDLQKCVQISRVTLMTLMVKIDERQYWHRRVGSIEVRLWWWWLWLLLLLLWL